MSFPIVSTSEALSALDATTLIVTRLCKKIETIKHDMKVEEDTFIERKQPLDKDTGYLYYVREREAATRASTKVIEEAEAKIAALESKRDAAIAAIKAEYDRKIEAIERKKEHDSDGHIKRAQSHHLNVEGMSSKHEASRPNTQTYIKLKNNLETTLKESEDAEDKYQEANAQWLRTTERQSAARMRDYKEEQKAKEIARLLIENEERKTIAAKQVADHEAYMARYKERSSVPIHPQTSIAPKKKCIAKKKFEEIDFPLDIRRKYTIEQIDDLNERTDLDELTEEDNKILARVWAYASRRYDRVGWQSNIYNHINEDKDYDVMSVADFDAIYGVVAAPAAPVWRSGLPVRHGAKAPL